MSGLVYLQQEAFEKHGRVALREAIRGVVVGPVQRVPGREVAVGGGHGPSLANAHACGRPGVAPGFAAKRPCGHSPGHDRPLMEIADRRVATIHFTLLGQDGGEVTTTHGHDPLVYLHGTGGIVRGLEEALAGKKAGDRFEVEVAPEQGFGKRHDGLVQSLPRSMLDSAAEPQVRSEEHTSELQSLMRSSYAVFCLKKK